MLKMRQNCECCGRDLPGDSREAMICSFECTYCHDCAEKELNLWCPNCGGEIVRRPLRSLENLKKFPAATEWKINETLQARVKARGASVQEPK